MMGSVSLTILDTIRSFFGDFLNTDIEFDLNLDFLHEGFAQLQEAIPQLTIGSESIASAQVILLAAGITIFLGVAGEAFFKKTGIPDIAFLLILGVIIGPVLGIIQPDAVIQIVPYFAAVALIIIMFDGGINLDIRNVIKTAHFALLLTILGFVVSVTIVTLIAFYGLEWRLLDSILLGSIVGGSSSIIVFGLVRNVHISDETKSMLSLESAMTDVLAIIAAFILFDLVITGYSDPNLVLQTFGKAVATGLILGLGVGIPWMYVITKLGNVQHAYMLTLGMLFVLFFLANSFGESGALTALVFGLMLGNRNRLARYLRLKLPTIEMDDKMHNQLTFLVRSFFFVFIGLLASLGQIEYLIFGIIAALIIYLARIGVVKISLTKRFSLLDKKVTSAMIPRGLAAAVLATIPLTLGLPNAEAYPQIVFVIILSSVIITTVGMGKARKIEAIPTDQTDENP
ncbi:MAG: cation:proton antiporter [Nitrosopumilaceae archaeon]